MKKIYSLSLLFITALSFGQSVVITSVIDGTLGFDGCNSVATSKSDPKFVELYVSGTVNLSDYRLQIEPNGTADTGTWTNNFVYLNGTFTDEFVYVVNIPYNPPAPTPTQNDVFLEMYGSTISSDNIIFSSYGPNINGNDALRIAQYNGSSLVAVIDQYGNPNDVSNSGDYAATWAYQDGYAKRVNGTPANGGNFSNSSFIYSGNNVLDNITCEDFVIAVGLGTYNTVNSTKDFNGISGLKMYPNPLSGNVLYITSDANAEKTVTIYDILGKQVVNTTVANETLNVSNLSAGVYVVKITEAGKTATRKLVVK